MKTAALFIALSLSIVSGCGSENGGTSPSDDPSMKGKMDDPFTDLAKTKVYPAAPEGPLLLKTTVCKTDVYFYESKDGQSINWFGFWNKNDAIVHAYAYETRIMESQMAVILQPNQTDGGSDRYYPKVDRGHVETLYTEKLDSSGQHLLPCETAHITVP